jgi:carboxymethylenebutenolidase
MTRTIKTAASAIAGIAIAAVAIHAQRPAPGRHDMTPAEHLAHLAAAGNPHAGHALAALSAPALQAAPANAALPADEAGVADRLAKSPRKGEFVTLTVGGAPMRTWVVRPQGQARAPVVIVIQEIFGLSDWIRGVADQLAAEGFIAVAPDLLGDSTKVAANEMMQAHFALQQADIVAKLKAAREYGLKLPNANGKSATIGFCFGGNQSFLMAVEEPSLNAAIVYYGTAPTDAPAAAGGGRRGGGGGGAAAPFVPSDRLASIKAPVLGLYGGLKEDARIGVSIAPTEEKMKQLGKAYEPHVFDGAAHGFLRAQTGNNGANMKATQAAWPLTVNWIKKYAS